MRRFLTAFICLSTLAMAQNVIAAAPASAKESDEAVNSSVVSSPTGAESMGLRLRPDSEIPQSGTMLLLVAGLSGLTAVGARGDERTAIPRRSGLDSASS